MLFEKTIGMTESLKFLEDSKFLTIGVLFHSLWCQFLKFFHFQDHQIDQIPSYSDIKLLGCPELLSAPNSAPAFSKNQQSLSESAHKTKILYYRTPDTRNSLFKKQISLNAALNEIYARDMARLLHLEHLIPLNRICMPSQKKLAFFSKEKFCRLHKIKPSTFLYIEHFIKSCQNSLLKKKSKLGHGHLRVDYYQKYIPVKKHLKDLIEQTFSNQEDFSRSSLPSPTNSPELLNLSHTSSSDGTNSVSHQFLSSDCHPTGFNRIAKALYSQDQTKEDLLKINYESFQENFLLQFILGSQDAHADNVLITKEGLLYSIDNESIMPESSNVQKTAFIRTQQGLKKIQTHNVLALKMSLLCLVHAQLPLTTAFLKKSLRALDWKLFDSYHKKLNFFSKKAVNFQKQRFFFLKEKFKEEIMKRSRKEIPSDQLLSALDIIKSFYEHDPFMKSLSLYNHPLAYEYIGRVGSHFFSLQQMIQTLFFLIMLQYAKHFLRHQNTLSLKEILKNEFLVYQEFSNALAQFDQYPLDLFQEVKNSLEQQVINSELLDKENDKPALILSKKKSERTLFSMCPPKPKSCHTTNGQQETKPKMIQ